MLKRIHTPIVVSLLLLSSGLAYAQRSPHYPRLTSGEMPLYPSIARSAHIQGTVEIQVRVENGGVVDVRVQSPGSPYLINPTVANIKTWRFEPDTNASFLVKFIYEIRGKETLRPENPRVELDLPRLVKIIARPFKPTQT
jgi:TonB family protein